MKRTLQFFLITLLLSSCSRVLSPQVMFKTDKDSTPDSTRKLNSKNKEYILSPYDRLEMNLYSIEGFKLVDVTSASGSQVGAISYLIEEDGKVKLPIFGKIPLSGLTVREAEGYLESIYSKYYINPFILLKVINRHVYVFYAETGKGSIVNIANDNTNLIEVIALAGGLTDYSKAWRIKVIRGDPHNPQIRIVDMSTIDGLKSSDLSVQSNDIIYIEAAARISTKLLIQITPVIGLLTSILLIANLFKK
jgi:polysaccharide export outer membrane protein